VTGAASVTGSLTVDGSATVTGPTVLDGAVTVGEDDFGHTVMLYGEGAGKFVRWSSDIMTVVGGVDLTGDLTVYGDTELDGVLTVEQESFFSGAATFRGDVTVGEEGEGHNVKFWGALDEYFMEWDYDANRLVVDARDLVTTGDFSHTGAMGVTDGMSVGGSSQFLNMRVTGTFTIVNQRRRRLGEEEEEGAAGAGGDEAAAAADVEDEAAMRARLGVRKRADFVVDAETGKFVHDPSRRQLRESRQERPDDDDEAAAEGAARRELQLDEAVIIEGDVSFTGDFSVAGDFSCDGGMLVTGVLEIGDAATFLNTVTIEGVTTLNADLRMSGDLILGANTQAATATFFGTTSGAYFEWDGPVDQLYVSGKLTVQALADSTSSHEIFGPTIFSSGGVNVAQGGLTVGSGGGATISGNTAVDGALSVTRNLDVARAVTFGTSTSAHNFRVYGATGQIFWAAGSNTLTVQGTTSMTGNAGVTGNLDVAGDLSVAGEFNLEGDVTLTGTLTVGENLAGHDLRVHGAASNSYLRWNAVQNRLEVQGTTSLTGALTAASSAAIAGATTLGSTLAVAGAATLSGATTVANTLTVGASGAGRRTLLHGATAGRQVRYEADTLTVQSDQDVIGALSVTGNTVLSGGTLSVAGEATMAAVTANGALTVGAAANGHSVIFHGGEGDSRLEWDASSNSLSVAGALAVTAAADFESDVAVAGAVSVTGLGGLEVEAGPTLLGGSLTVGDAATGGADVAFLGSASGSLRYTASTNRLALTGSLTVSSGATLTGAVQVVGPLAVTGASSLQGTVNIAGATTVASTFAATGAASLGGGATVTGGGLTVGASGAGQNVRLWGASATKFVNWNFNSNLFTVEGDVAVAGTVSLAGAVGITGALSVTDGVAVGGVGTFDLGVEVGTSTAGADLMAYGTSGYAHWDASADLLDIAGSLAISGDTAMAGLTTVAGQLLVEAEANFTRLARLEAGADVGGDVDVAGDVGVAGALAVTGGASVDGGASVSGNVHLGGLSSDTITFGGSMGLPRHRVDVLATSSAESCVVNLLASPASYSVVIINATASAEAGCRDWITLMTPLCDDATSGVVLGLTALGDELDAIPVYAHDGDSGRSIFGPSLPSADAAAANAARVGAHIFPIYGGYSGVSLVCTPAGTWEKINGGASSAEPGTQDAERLIIDTGDFDFIGGVNLNAVKDNATNASDVGDISISAAPSFAGTSDDGGSLYLVGGAAYAGDGGDVAVQAGASSVGIGGSVNVQAGAAASAAAAGSISLLAGSSATGAGGDVSITSGSSGGAGDAGDISVVGGSSATGAGASVFLQPGTGAGSNGVMELLSASGSTSLSVDDEGVKLDAGKFNVPSYSAGAGMIVCMTAASTGGNLGFCAETIAQMVTAGGSATCTCIAFNA